MISSDPVMGRCSGILCTTLSNGIVEEHPERLVFWAYIHDSSYLQDFILELLLKVTALYKRRIMEEICLNKDREGWAMMSITSDEVFS